MFKCLFVTTLVTGDKQVITLSEFLSEPSLEDECLSCFRPLAESKYDTETE